MPPNADKLRQRSTATSIKTGKVEDVSAVANSTSTTRDRICSIENLKPNEVCIDGSIYDLTDFDHPGGDVIHVFGGNDVTVQYKMIHPRHTSKHVEKMTRVGKVADFTSEYKFDTEFEREIKNEVFKIVRRGREFGTPGWFFRAIGYVSLYFYLQYLWVTQGASWQLAIVYGVSQALIGLNVQHDANHGSCSGKRPWINDLFGIFASFIGGDKWLWMEQHWTHHTYTNHAERDPDSFGAEPFMLFNDYPAGHPARKGFHSFQILYYLPVLAGYWLSSVFNPEVLDLRQRGALGVGMKMESDFIKSRRKYAAMIRLLYIYIHAVVPFRVAGGFSWSVLGDILLMGAFESLTLAVLFSLSHNFENADRDPTGPVAQTGEPVCWYKSQVETSATYGGFVSGCLTGGLNFQVEHHLFPRMSSAWYPYIAPTVRKVCEKHGVRYAYYPWVWQNLISTLKYMHAAGTGSHWKNNPLSGKL